MDTVRSRMAVGAAWMMGLRLIDRSLGIVSTLILARLLLPADFGLIAMAMTILGILEVLGSFSFDIALIQNQLAEPRHYNTAWTLTVMYGAANALALFVLAGPAGGFFSEPRLEAVLYVLALTAVVQGFENIGIVAFRKELNFSRELLFQFVKRLIAFAITIALAYLLRSYWALAIGTLSSRIAGVAFSYVLHP